MRFMLVVVYLISTISGLILMKLGGNPGTIAIKENNIAMSMNLISGIGFVCYIFSFLLFTRIVVMFDLSYIFPICTGVVQVATLIASYYIFKEKIPLTGVIGASLIIIGIIIMNLKFKNVDNSKLNANVNIETNIEETI